MKAKYLSLLLAAALMGQAPTMAFSKDNKAKTEQKAKDKKTDKKKGHNICLLFLCPCNLSERLNRGF